MAEQDEDEEGLEEMVVGEDVAESAEGVQEVVDLSVDEEVVDLSVDEKVVDKSVGMVIGNTAAASYESPSSWGVPPQTPLKMRLSLNNLKMVVS